MKTQNWQRIRNTNKVQNEGSRNKTRQNKQLLSGLITWQFRRSLRELRWIDEYTNTKKEADSEKQKMLKRI